MGLDGLDGLPHKDRLHPFNPHHPGNVGAVDIRIQQAHPFALLRQGQGQV